MTFMPASDNLLTTLLKTFPAAGTLRNNHRVPVVEITNALGYRSVYLASIRALLQTAIQISTSPCIIGVKNG